MNFPESLPHIGSSPLFPLFYIIKLNNMYRKKPYHFCDGVLLI